MAETFDSRGGVSGGRKKISEQGRQSFSKRALQGKIQIIKKKCPYCGHNKIKRNESTNSAFFDKEFCTRCKKDIKRQD